MVTLQTQLSGVVFLAYSQGALKSFHLCVAVQVRLKFYIAKVHFIAVVTSIIHRALSVLLIHLCAVRLRLCA